MDKWFTRFEQGRINSTYLNNMLRSTAYFIDWFNNNTIPYCGMLIRMHSIAADGYGGYTGGCHHSPVSSKFRDFTVGTYVLRKEWFSDIDNKPIIRPKVKNISGEASHWIKNLDDGYELHLPAPKYIPHYVCLLGKLMCGMKQAFSLRLLADYIQLFVCCHPFSKVNFSICMNQVNALLDMHGYNTIYHGYIDFECFMRDHNIVTKLFIDKITS